MLLAYDTELRLQKEKIGKAFALDAWVVEAGPDYFDDTVAGMQKAISQAKDAIAKRNTQPYQNTK